MSGPLSEQNEFMAVHSAVLGSIADKTRNLLAAHRSQIITYSPETDTAEFVLGATTADDIYRNYGNDLAEADAQELADSDNKASLGKAVVAAIGFNARCTLRHTFMTFEGMRQAGFTDEESIEHASSMPASLNYQQATVEKTALQTANPTRNIELVRLVLTGLEHYGEAAQYQIAVTDEHLIQTFNLGTVGGKLETIDVDYRDPSDTFFERAIGAFGIEAFDKDIKPLLLTQFENEEDLEEKLADIRSWHISDSDDTAEFDALVDEIRTRATSQRHFIGLGQLSLPDAETLRDIDTLLAELNA